MKLIGIEEHFLTTEVRDAWHAMALEATDPGVAYHAGAIEGRLIDLADRYEDKKDPDPEIMQIRKIVPDLRDTLLFALETISKDERVDYWTLVSIAELHVMTTDSIPTIERSGGSVRCTLAGIHLAPRVDQSR